MISTFQRYLSVWVLLCMEIGLALGVSFLSIPVFLETLSIQGISIPIAVLIWIMIISYDVKSRF